ncbi:MAG: pyridoxamine 5'-phosphate oxidase family protein [Ilumatobacteraceae bacterium]
MTDEKTESKALKDIIKPGDVAMVVTSSNGKLSSRPLTVASVQTDDLLFLIDRRADWLTEKILGEHVHVAISAGGRNDWVSVNGKASLNDDRTLIRELWTPFAGAYFDSEDDPNVVVLDIAVNEGEYWSAPGGGPFGRLISIVSTALGHEKGPGAGEHGTIA